MSDDGKTLIDLDLAALRRGERAEFAKLVDATSASIYHLGLKMLNDSQDAEDVLQETYLKALRALPAFEGRSSLGTWLHRIAVNEALMMLRKRRPVISIDEDPVDDEGAREPLQLVDFSQLPERELLSAESQNFLDSAIQRLGPGLREVFVLRDMEGLSIKETAEALNLTEMNVKTRLLRARLKLREDLSGYFTERLREDEKNDKRRSL